MGLLKKVTQNLHGELESYSVCLYTVVAGDSN